MTREIKEADMKSRDRCWKYERAVDNVRSIVVMDYAFPLGLVGDRDVLTSD